MTPGRCPACDVPYDDHKLPTPVLAMGGRSISKPICPPRKK